MSLRPTKAPAHLAALAFALLAAAQATGCGVAPESQPRTVQPPLWPVLSSHPAANPTGAIPEKLYLVRDGALIAVTRYVNTPPTVNSLIADLIAAPVGTERDAGLTSALLGTNLIVSVAVANRRATVQTAAPADGAARSDEQLAYAQIVCTLTELPAVDTVVFTRDGEQIGVPRGDGSRSSGPLSAADYAGLIAAG